MRIIRLLYVVVIVSVVMFLHCAYADDSNKDIIVRDAWVRAMPPGQKVTAAYMVIENRTDKKLSLLSASTDVAEVIEIHEMTHVNGMMRMKMLQQLDIPARSQAVFNSEGLHLMIINLKKPISEGDTIPIMLNLTEGISTTVNATVRKEE